MIENLDNEIWATHPLYTDYAASNLGRIKHITKKGIEKLNKLTPTDKGYLEFGVYQDGKQDGTPRVHRFVWECFNQQIIPKGCSELQINHIDENKTNNRIENLELCTPQYNVDYSQAKTVGQYTLDGNLVRIWKSTMECGRNGYNFGHIASCCRGERKTHHNFIWRYIDDDTETPQDE